MDKILEGVSKFTRDVFPQHHELFQQLAQGQNPEVLFITCADSRVVPDMITQSKPGDLFICRNAGNMVPPYGEVHGGVSATIEYAVAVLEIKHIVVCGHTDCGAMKGVLYPEKVAALPAVRSWLHHGEMARRIVEENYGSLNEDQKLAAVTEENVIAQLEHLHTHPSVASRIVRGELNLHGWIYNIGQGTVTAWDPPQSRFVPLDEIDVSKLAGPARLSRTREHAG